MPEAQDFRPGQQPHPAAAADSLRPRESQPQTGWPRALWLAAVLAIAYVLLGRLAFSFSVQEGYVTSAVFASEGVALGFAILYGPRVVPGVLVGQAALLLWSGASLPVSLAIGLVNSLEALLGIWLFRHWKVSPALQRPRDVTLLLAMIFLILQPFSASGAMAVHYLLGALPAPQNLPPAWTHWWVANTMGQLLMTPLLLTWLSPQARPVRQHRLRIALHCACLAALIGLIVSRFVLHPLLLLAITYPLLMWIGIQSGLRAAVLANAILAPTMIWAGSTSDHLLQAMPLAERIAYVSFFLASGCILSLLVASLFQERRDLIDRLTHLANTDSLTGLSTRRRFFEYGEHELERARRYDRPLCLLVIDIDHFKAINDQFGHGFGDAVIRTVANCCTMRKRASDLAGRLGGEEFAIVLPEATAKGAREMGESLRQLVAATTVEAPDGSARAQVSISVGVACLSDETDLSSLLAKADRALYAAKHGGRDQVWLAGATD